jgi:hypothetical protein
VNWRPWLEDGALRQMQGLPSEAFDMLVRTLARICDDPYDPVFSAPVPPVPGRRVADLDDFGFIEFIADEAEGLVRVYHLVWTGLAITTSPPSANSSCGSDRPLDRSVSGPPSCQAASAALSLR